LIAAPASSSLSPDWAELAQSRFEMLYYYLQMAARCAEKNLRDIGKRPSIILLKQLTLGNGACGAIRRAERRRKSSASKNIVGAGGAFAVLRQKLALACTRSKHADPGKRPYHERFELTSKWRHG
jgi:hypothetical protein